MAAGCGAARSCGRAVVGCAAAEESRLPTECAGVALEQLVGSEPDGKRKSRQARINRCGQTQPTNGVNTVR